MSDDGSGPVDPKRSILDRIRNAAEATAPKAAPARASLSGPSSSVSSQTDDSSGGGGKRDAPAAGDDGAGNGSGGDDARGGTDWDMECARLPLMDLGNTQRFVLRHGDGFLYCAKWGWLAWDGRRWSRECADGMLARAVLETVMAIPGEARAWAESGEDIEVDVKKNVPVYWSDRIREWGRTSQASAHINCIEGLAQALLEARVTDFDADPMAFNVLNGTLRFKVDEDGGDTVTLHPHDRADRITRLAPVEYDAQAECPVYDASLARVRPDDGIRRHLHCWGGISLTGDVSIQRLTF